MTKPIFRIFTRPAAVGVIQSHQHEQDAPNTHPQSARPRSSFPLTLTVGLMTIGVIAIVSLLQLLSSYLG